MVWGKPLTPSLAAVGLSPDAIQLNAQRGYRRMSKTLDLESKVARQTEAVSKLPTRSQRFALDAFLDCARLLA